MRQIIHRGAHLELTLVEDSLQNLIPETKAKIAAFFSAIHASTSPSISFAELLSAQSIVSPIAHDYHTSIRYLDEKVNEFLYNLALSTETKRLKAEQLAAKRAASEEMEVETSNDILVATLVRNAIAQTTKSLRKEVDTLRAALKAQASRLGQSTGKPKGKGPAKAHEQRVVPSSKQKKAPSPTPSQLPHTSQKPRQTPIDRNHRNNKAPCL